MSTEFEIKYPQPAPYRGLDVSLPQNEIDVRFSPDLNNCETVDGVVQKRRGYSQLLAAIPVADEIMDGFQFGDAAGTQHLVFCTPTEFIEYNSGGTWSERHGGTLFTGTVSNPVFMANVGALSTDALFISNGKDVIKKWTGTGNWSNISLTGYTTLLGTCITGFKGHLVLGNVTEDGTQHVYRIVWSNAGDPEDYSGVSAGFLNLIEDAENTKIMCLHPLKLSLMAYKAKSIYNLEYRGGRNGIYFASDMVISDSGAISPKAVTPIGDLDLHFVVTQNNVELFDGFQFVKPSIGNRIKKLLFDDSTWGINWAQREKLFVKDFPAYKTVGIIYPGAGQTNPDRGFFWEYENVEQGRDAWHPFTMADDAHSLIYTDLFFSSQKALMGIDANVMELFTGTDDNGTDINAYFVTKLNDYSDLDPTLRYARKVGRRVELDHSGTLPTVEFGATSSILDTPSYDTAITLADDPQGLARITPQKSGRYHCIKVSDNSSDAAFKVAGIVTYASRSSGR